MSQVALADQLVSGAEHMQCLRVQLKPASVRPNAALLQGNMLGQMDWSAHY